MVSLSQLLTPERTVCYRAMSSQKRVFEHAAKLVAQQFPALNEDDVFSQLLAREKLGSTGLSAGVALPHCRVEAVESPTGCLMTLEQGVDFDAPDGRPVDLLFFLLVPVEAHQLHLDILAMLARRFSNSAWCQQLRQSREDQDLYHIAVFEDEVESCT